MRLSKNGKMNVKFVRFSSKFALKLKHNYDNVWQLQPE